MDTDDPARTGPAVRLRPLAVDDLVVHAAGCDELIERWTNGGRRSTTAEHCAWLERNARAWHEGADLLDLAVVDAATGEHVGVVGIQRRRPELGPGEVNLTYALYPGGATRRRWSVRRWSSPARGPAAGSRRRAR